MPFAGASSMPGLGGRLTLLFGLLLAVSALTGWYRGEGEGTTVSVIGWHTGTIGKVVLFLGLAAVLLVVLREVGVELARRRSGEPGRDRARLDRDDPRARPAHLDSRHVLLREPRIGIWISLACAVGIIVAGLLAPKSCSAASPGDVTVTVSARAAAGEAV